MRMQFVRVVVIGTGLAAWLGACGISLDVAPDDGADAEAASSSSSSSASGGASSSSGATSSSGAVQDSGPTSASSGSSSDGCTAQTREKACVDFACGAADDGCGNTIPCDDTCIAPQKCGGGTPSEANQCGCTAATPACAGGKNCDSITDECGVSTSCGPNCAGRDKCIDNVCVCQDDPHACDGKQCGDVPNGCGAMISCGVCVAPASCGGGGAASKCGCTPLTPDAAGCPDGVQPTCVFKENGCGGFVDCGNCGPHKQCKYNGAGNENTCVGN